MAVKRVAIVIIPHFSMAVFSKTQTSRAHGAVALAETIDDTSPVIAVNDSAALAGITCGMTVSQAQAFCSGLSLYQRDSITERAESQAIAGWLGAFSPTVSEEIPGRYRLDASGMMLLYRDEATYADRIISALRPLGYPLQIGVAKNPFVARVAAERAERHGCLIVPAQSEKQFLSGLRREYLEMSQETASLLHDLGIEEIAQVSAVPINEMTERFGSEGQALVTLARGENPESRRSKPLSCRRRDRASARGFDILSTRRQVGAPDATHVAAKHIGRVPNPGRPGGRDEKPDTRSSGILSPDQFTTTRFFSAPLEQTQHLRQHINQLLGDLLERLAPFGFGCGCVEIKLHLDNRTEQIVSLTVAKPTASLRLFLRQWQMQSEALKLESGITGMTVAIPHLQPLLIEQIALQTHRTQATPPVALPEWVRYPQLCSGILPESCFELVDYARPHADQSCDSPPQDLPERRALSGFSSRQGGTSEPDLQDCRCEERLHPGRGIASARLKRDSQRQIRNSQQHQKHKQQHDLVASSVVETHTKRVTLNRQRFWQSFGLRLIQPPRLVRMDIENDRPTDFTWAGRHRRIIRTEGPWELSGHWWQAGFHRRYYEIVTDACQRYLVFCEDTEECWFVQGVFD